MKTLEAGKRVALSSVLFATDFSPYSDAALPYARAIAREYGAKLFATHVVSADDYLFTAPDLWPAQRQKEKQLQTEVENRLEKQLQGMPHKVLFAAGDVWTVISRILQEDKIDLLVMGTHGRTGAKKVVLGSIAEKIFRQACCPVLTVGPNAPRKSDDEIHFKNILLATDFGKESLAALPYAVSLAEENQSQLSLLHVVGQPAAGIVDLEEVKTSVMRRLEELVPTEAEPWCHTECRVEFSRQFATPEERILEIARERQAELIVIGLRPTHHALVTVTHFGRTTAQHIVAQAACPVLTVRG